ncbi:hypothetical protein [Sulfurihydrogenibium sp.]|uniref:hypothetical protein n=1 Tax=Sulfurihydrogenibium sp. TaxID=2053621 RepID=UPI00261DE5B3|nr:hypothetical protein [Sulfurihydrogenibium sp.]
MSGADLILEFLKEGKEEGLEVIRNIFFSKINKQTYQILKNEQEDLFGDFLAEKLLPYKKNILERFKNGSEGLTSYISTAIENFLKTALEKAIHMSEVFDDSVYLYQEEDENPLEKRAKKEVDFLIHIESERIFEIMKVELKEEEQKLLCYMLSDYRKQQSLKDSFYKELKDDALYKRVERFKKRLSEIVKKYEFSKNAVEHFFDSYYKEVCIKIYEVDKL